MSSDSSALPAEGTQYSVTDFGLGIENVYESAPASDGASPETTDVLVTPLGNIDLPIDSDLFGSDLTSLGSDLFGPSGLDVTGGLLGSSSLDASDAFNNGIDTNENLGLFGVVFDSFDKLLESFNQLLPDTGNSIDTDASASDIQSAISDVFDSDLQHLQDSDFSGAHSSLSDVADALANSDSTDVLGGDVSGDAVINALHNAGISISDSGVSASAIADMLNSSSSETASLAADTGGDTATAGGSEAGGGIGDLLSSLF